MAIFRPGELEYDEELYEKLQSRDKSLLCRFYNHHCEKIDEMPVDESAHTQDDFRKIIASKFEEEIEQFFDRYERLVDEGVRTDPAIEYLAEHSEIGEEDLAVDTRYELLMLLYEEELLDRLDELLIRANVRSYKASKTYILDLSLNLDDLETGLDQFHQEWNIRDEDIDAVLVDKEFEADNLVVLKIYQEVGAQSKQTFEFRQNNADEIPVKPSLARVNYTKLKTLRFQIEEQDDAVKIVFTDSPYMKWRTTLNRFFESVFGVEGVLDEIEEDRSAVAEDIEEEISEAIDDGDDPVERARNTISSKRSDAVDRVDDLDIPEGRREELKERIETIEISGSEVVDDQSIQTQEFRLIAALEELFDSVDLEEGFRDLMEKSASDKQSFVLTVNGRAVEFSDGTWSKLGPGQLPSKDKRALQIFFDGDEGL